MPLVAARSGRSPLAQDLFSVLDSEAAGYGEGVAGGKGLLGWVAEDAMSGWSEGGAYLPHRGDGTRIQPR
jgi:hypothetical protein